MAELGVDISDQRCKSVDTVDPTTVDTVVTLCADEVCPTFLRATRQIHWALPDPAAATGPDADRLEQFRKVRDEIGSHLRDLDVVASPRDRR